MKTLISTICAILMTLSSSSFAETTPTADAYARLDRILVLKDSLGKKNTEFAIIENDLKVQLQKSRNQKIGKIILGTAAVAAIATIYYGYKFNAAKDIDIIVRMNQTAIAAGATVTLAIVGGVVYFSNKNDAKLFLAEVTAKKLEIETAQASLKNEVKKLCEVEPRHALCY